MKLPRRFADLAREASPQAIRDDSQYDAMLAMVDRLMAVERLALGQSIYLETLVQLVQAYEGKHHAVESSDLRGLDTLKHLLAENGMNATDLSRVLSVHASLGSKILKGARSLTIEHVRKLAARFRVGPEVFIG